MSRQLTGSMMTSLSQPPGDLQHPQGLSGAAAPRVEIAKQFASQPRRSWGGRISTACLYAILISSPLLLGSNRPVFWAANALMTSLALLGLAARHRPAVPIFSAPVPILLCAGLTAVMLWMVFQAVTWTPSVLHHFVWADAAAYVHATGAISINPAQTWAALAWSASLLIVVPAINVGTSRRGTRRTLWLMAWVAVAIAVFGIVVERLDLQTLGLVKKTLYLGSVTGTFVNRNTAATYFALALCIALALVSAPTHVAGRRRSEPLLQFGSVNVLALAMAVCLYTALLMTNSRGGIIAGMSGALLVLGLSFMNRRRTSWLVLAVGPCIAVGIVAALHALLARESTSLGSNLARLALYREALAAIADRPLLGHGAGTFADVEPLYHSPGVPSGFVWPYAHSSYLEAAVSLGLPVALMGLMLLLGIVAWLFRTVQIAHPEHDRQAIFAALGASAAALIHSAVDFSLQTQAVAIAYVALLGLAIGQALLIRASLASTIASRIIVAAPARH
jgi:O-antigen ligase